MGKLLPLRRLQKKKGSKTKSIKSKVETKNDLEFGMSDAVKKKREEIKAIKEKRRKSKIVKEDSSNNTKPAKSPKSDKKTTKKPEKDKVPKRRLSKLKSNGVLVEGDNVYKQELILLKEENIEIKKQLKMSNFIKKK